MPETKKSSLDSFFKLTESKTTVKTEILAVSQHLSPSPTYSFSTPRFSPTPL